MKSVKKLLILVVLLTCFFNKINATTLGPIDIIGYPSQGPALDTLRNAFYYFSNPEDSFWKQQFFLKDNFYDNGFVYNISIFDDKPKMHYKLWMQVKPAPLITIIPGLGSLYLEQTLMLLANTFYNAGYSVVVISNAFSWEFMQSAASVPTPGYTIRDAQDTYYALYKINTRLKEKYGDRITDNILVGYSMGALYTLFISELDKKYNLIDFARYLAINPPLDLIFGMKILDDYFRIIDSWPRTKVDEKANSALFLYSQLIEDKLDINEEIPLDSAEAQYVIGLIFHNTIVDMLASIHQRNVGGDVVSTPFMWYNKSKLYRELNNYNFYKYLKLFVMPYYSKEFGSEFTIEEFNEWASLKNFDKDLESNSKIRIIHNINDFLITDEDKLWFNKVFGDRLIFFSHGGHLGNMFFPEVQKFILEGVNLKNKKGFTGSKVEKIKKKAYEKYIKGQDMDSKERISTIINGGVADRCGFWLGNPDEKTWPILHNYFNTTTEEELRIKLHDDVRWICPQFFDDIYQDPDGRPMFDFGFDKKTGAHNVIGPLADCETVEDLEKYPWPDPDYLSFDSTIKALKSADNVYRMSGFWTCFYHNLMDLFGMEEYLMKMYLNPEVVLAATDKVCEFYYEANRRFFEEAGGLFEAFFFGNDFGTQKDTICSPKAFDKYIMPWFKKFTQLAHAYDKKVVLHSCGAIHKVIGRLIDAEVDCLHPLQALAANMDADSLAADFKGKIAFMGGIDTQNLLINGTVEEIKADVKRVKEILGPNIIISPSHEALLPDIPPENVEAMAEEAFN